MLIKPEDAVPAYRLKVYLDGELILKPYLVDTYEGYVEYYKVDADGFMIGGWGGPESERTYGDITFEIE